MMFAFNLLEEKWLPCVMMGNSLHDLSLRDVLLDAENVREIVGDSPPVTIALHRLLLAILHRALYAPQSAAQWNEIREAEKFDRAKLENYFENHKTRFDLFDEKYPFYQSPSARENVQSGAIIQLYFQGKNNATLFEHSTITAPNKLTAAEAARFLIAFQGFDFGGIKADGSAQTAPLLQSAIALIKGENLFETLLLNLHSYNSADQEPFDFSYAKDLPAWEHDEETQSVERLPNGYVDLLTWQARRIYLQPERNENDEIIVKNTVIMRGYSFPKGFERKGKETMLGFQIGKDKTKGFYTVRFNENKSLWRNSFSLLQNIRDDKNRAKTLSWLSELVNEGYLNRTDSLPIEFYGMTHDSQSIAKLLFWQIDGFNLPLAYLNDDQSLLELLKVALEFSQEIGDKLRDGVKKLADLLQTNIANFQAMPIYWSTLELKFQRLLSALPIEREVAMREWFGEVLATADNAFEQTTNSLSGSAEELKATVEARRLYGGLRYKTKEAPNFKIYLPETKSKGGIQ